MDFIPVLGYLDDLILVPLGIALAVKMIPESVLVDCRAKAQTGVREADESENRSSHHRDWLAAAALLIWLVYSAGQRLD